MIWHCGGKSERMGETLDGERAAIRVRCWGDRSPKIFLFICQWESTFPLPTYPRNQRSNRRDWAKFVARIHFGDKRKLCIRLEETVRLWTLHPRMLNDAKDLLWAIHDVSYCEDFSRDQRQ